MTIRRLDVFFRTQITLQQPEFFNTVTNLALAPLQRLIGQNRFHTHQKEDGFAHRVIRSDPQPTLPPVYCATFRKVVVVVGAFFLALVLTPVGIATRLMSFREFPVYQAYSQVYLLQLTPYERTPAAMKEACAFLERLTPKACSDLLLHFPEDLNVLPFLSATKAEHFLGAKAENEKKKPLDKALSNAVQVLERLEAKLKASLPIDQMRNDPLYPFPFYLAQQLEKHPKVVARADTALWEKFMTLRQSCLTYLPANCDDQLMETTRTQAKAVVLATFRPNSLFFKELKEKLESKAATDEIRDWIEGKRRASDYSYPFFTHPGILKFLWPPTTTAEKFQPLSDLFDSCLRLLRQKGLENYISERPDPHHVAVNAVMLAMDQIENISKLQELIKNQTA